MDGTMKLEIHAGGLNYFFRGVSSFVREGNGSGNEKLINNLQNVIQKTNDLNDGVGELGEALGYIRARQSAQA